MNEKLAFGTYRTGLDDLEHEAALTLALKEGIRLIDTSTNYMNGDAERLIAKVLENAFGGHKPEDVEIISKCGYIEGALLEEIKKADDELIEELDIVKFNENTYHSIHPGFIKAELTKSLERLNLKKLDCYLIDSPEYYLMSMINDETQRPEAQMIMLDRILDAFMQLETEVKEGRIDSYGIASNSFSLNANDLYFLPYEDLIGLATKAALEVGNINHNLSTLEFPMNLLEQEGTTCAAWAHANGLRVIVYRPLNATKDNLMYRLASHEEPKDYFALLNETMGFLEEAKVDSIFNMINELDNYKHRFGWVGEYQSFLMTKIIPHIRTELKKITDDYTRENISSLLMDFFAVYEDMVLYECTKQTQLMLKNEGIEIKDTIEEVALKVLIDNADVDYVLVGMRRTKYVNAFINVLD